MLRKAYPGGCPPTSQTTGPNAPPPTFVSGVKAQATFVADFWAHADKKKVPPPVYVSDDEPEVRLGDLLSITSVPDWRPAVVKPRPPALGEEPAPRSRTPTRVSSDTTITTASDYFGSETNTPPQGLVPKGSPAGPVTVIDANTSPDRRVHFVAEKPLPTVPA